MTAIPDTMRFGVGTCFSSWIGRANDTPNLGLLDHDDAAELSDRVLTRFGIFIPLTKPDSPRTLGALARRISMDFPQAEQGVIWQTLRSLCAAQTHIPQNDIHPELTFFERRFD